LLTVLKILREGCCSVWYNVRYIYLFPYRLVNARVAAVAVVLLSCTGSDVVCVVLGLWVWGWFCVTRLGLPFVALVCLG